MATQNTIGIGINISDNGTAKKTIKNIEALHSSIKALQATANKGVNVSGGAAAAGTAGSKKAAASAAYQPGAAAARFGATTGSTRASAAAAAGSSEIAQYGSMRGSAGATGASARDFANQAQGLGGLVRLYATYAANIFAVGAAFRALSSAMDTANMVKGLDQLGAASGTALGSLSKRFVTATDGAVSLREAMEAVTKASSSGMSDSDILRVATSAKQAAQALGVDMSDAVSRLTRGITKMEPELLDELGIFVRVDDAVKAYAKSVGKSASALTDFERRMAFSNAALTQSEKKFGEIKLDTNPYTQLLAVIKDLSQSVLEVVNVALVPLVKILSSNPTALLAVLGTIGVTLAKQAIPALADYRKSLQETADMAKKIATARLQDLKSSASAEINAKVASIESAAEAEVAALDAAAAKMAAAGKKVKKYDSRAFEISQMTIQDISEEDILYLEKLGEKNTKVSATYRDMAGAIRNYLVAEDLYTDAKKEQNIVLNEGSSLWTTIGQNELEYHNQVNDARQRSMISSVAYTASTEGLIAGLQESWEAFKEAGESTDTTIDILDKAGERTGATLTTTTRGLGLLGRSALLARLGITSIIASVGTAINAFMPWIQLIGYAVAAFGVLSSYMTENSEEMKAFDDSIEGSKASIKTLGETLDFINEKPFGQQFSTESLEARAKAFGEVGSSVEALVKDLEKTNKAAGGFDKFIDGFLVPIGKDVRSKFADSMTDTITTALDKAGTSAEAGKAREKIAKLLNIDPKFTNAEFNKAIAQAADNTPLLKDVSKAMKGVGIEAGITASKSKELNDSLKASADAYKAVTDQFKSKDPLSLLGSSLVASSQKLAQALEDPNTALQKLTEIANDPNKLKLFGAEDQTNLSKYSGELENINKQIQEQATSVDVLRQQQKKANEELEAALSKQQDFGGSTAEDDSVMRKAGEISKNLAQSEIRLAKARSQAQEIINKLPNLVTNQLKKGADLIAVGITAAMAKASNIFKETVLGTLGDIPGVAKAREKIELSKLAADRSLIEVQQQLIRVTMENTVATQLASARAAYEDKATQAREARGTGGTGEAALAAYKTLQELEVKQKIVQMDPKDVRKSLDSMIAAVKAGNKEIGSDSTAMLEYLNSVAGSGIQLAAAAEKERAIKYTAIVEQTKEVFSEEQKALAAKKEANNIEQQRITNLETIQGYSTAETILAADLANTTAINLDAEEKLLAVQQRRKLLELAQKSGAVSEVDFNKGKTNLDDLEKQIQDRKQVNLETAAANSTKNAKELIKSLTEQKILETANKDVALQSLDIQEKQLTKDLERNNISKQAYTSQLQNIENSRIDLELQSKLSELQKGVTDKIITISTQLDQPGLANTEIKMLKQLAVEADSAYSVAVSGALAWAKAQKDNIVALTDEQKRMANFESTVEKLFESMADAMVEFALTGKASFKDLINNMLADLLRYEMRQQQLALFNSLGNGKGILNSIGSAVMSVFGGSPTAASSSSTYSLSGASNFPSSGLGLRANAKGGTFGPQGVMEFAKGGAFTNSIVDTPTQFKFAKGVGLMGEAGPEAIMPLKRDAAGNLGVRSQGGTNVDVVVNNYSTERAETKETVDSRGNRKIEIVVGEMVASEVSRNGSPVNNSIRNTFNSRPNLIRR